MNISLSGKNVLVTGGAGGIGVEIVKSMHSMNANIIISGSNEQKLKSFADKFNPKVNYFVANLSKVKEVDNLAENALTKFNNKLDILVNNAGILRDKSFSKVTDEDFRLVLEVHLMGTVNCTKAVWEIMKEQNYGRILVTSSSSGVYGNFGQTNYGAAKMGVLGLINTLKLEGAKYNIKCNGLTPVAGTRMTEDLMPPEVIEKLQPECVSPAVTFMVSEDAPTGVVMAAGAGVFARIITYETMGMYFGTGEEMNADSIAANWEKISDMTDARPCTEGNSQSMKMFELISKS